MGTRRRNASRVMPDVGAGLVVAAFATLGAAAIHIASAADHYAAWWPAGVFFYAVGLFQAGWAAAALLAPGPATMVLGLITNAGVIAVWAVSRTAGIPMGPSAGVPDAISRVGITAVVLEAVICLVALWHVRPRAPRGFASSLRAVVLIGAAGAAVTGMTMPAVEGAMSHSHSHGSAEGSAASGHGGHGGGVAEPQHDPSGAAPGSAAAETPPVPPARESGASSEPSEEPAHDEHGHGAEPHEH